MSVAPLEQYVVELKRIGRQYGMDPPVHALVDVDLQVRPGEWLSITGPSGSGKSTLLHILGCLDHPTSGTYRFGGLDITDLSDRARAGLRSRRIGFVFQSFHLLPYRTVLENVMLAEVYRHQSFQGRQERAMAALERVGMGDRAHFLPTKLSGGQKQRAAIARALVGSPSLLLCDEPTGNLDSASGANILELFESLHAQGLTLVVVTHNEEVADRAERRVQIVDGRLMAFPGAKRTPTMHPPAEDIRQEPMAVTRSGITLRDLSNEAIAGMFARPGRTMLTILGIVIGLTALVATLGLSRTASNRIISQFDELAATEIIISPQAGARDSARQPIPWDAADRLKRLNGVVAAGTMSEVDVASALVSASPIKDPQQQTAFNLAVKAVSPKLFDAVRADLRRGRWLDLGHSARADRVALLGPDAARRLRISDLEQLPAIAIGDRLYLVIGVLDTVARQPELLASVLIPEGTAQRDFGLAGPDKVVVETQIGAASLIAQQAPVALRPDDPGLLKLEVPLEPQRVREAVASDLNMMFLLLGGLSLVVGAIGIANITLVSVMERTGEIGLRRSIGATRGQIAAQFLLESTFLGLLGGILGASIGILIVVIVSAYQVWTPVLDPAAPFVATVLGGAVGLLSGLYPALRAARLEPAEAVRVGV